MSNLVAPLQGHFKAVADSRAYGGPLGELIARLADGNLTIRGRQEILQSAGVSRDLGHRKAELDLLLSCVQEAIDAGAFNAKRQLAFLRLKELFEVQEGEFLRHRPVELATLLNSQLDQILEDDVIDPKEDVQQVALQDAFDLGYDQYLALCRKAFENAAQRLRGSLAHQRDPYLVQELKGKLDSLEPLIRLAELQHRSLGALY